MQASTFWKTVTMDTIDLQGTVLEALESAGLRYCIVGGQAVNAYAEPVVSLDLDIALAAGVHLSAEGSDLRIQTDPRYESFPDRAETRTVLGHELPVASLEEVLEGTIRAASDETRRASKRQKDLADIARLLEAYLQLREQVPTSLLARLFG